MELITTIQKVILRSYWRLNSIIGYIILTPIDFMIAKTTDKTWDEVRKISMDAIKRSWYKY